MDQKLLDVGEVQCPVLSNLSNHQHTFDCHHLPPRHCLEQWEEHLLHAKHIKIISCNDVGYDIGCNIGFFEFFTLLLALRYRLRYRSNLLHRIRYRTRCDKNTFLGATMRLLLTISHRISWISHVLYRYIRNTGMISNPSLVFEFSIYRYEACIYRCENHAY
jgi:hypothetical protein